MSGKVLTVEKMIKTLRDCGCHHNAECCEFCTFRDNGERICFDALMLEAADMLEKYAKRKGGARHEPKQTR